MFKPKTRMSNVWCGITDNAKFIDEGLQIAVSNGTSTIFWGHRWVTKVPPADPTDIAGATVAEMWDEFQGWKWDMFASFLPQDTLKLIQNHELKQDATRSDLVYWRDGKKGKFTIRSALTIMRNEHEMVYEDCWNLIWTAPVQQRIRAFLWIVGHD